MILVIENDKREKLIDQFQWLRGFLQGISYFGDGSMGHALESAEGAVEGLQDLIFSKEKKVA